MTRTETLIATLAAFFVAGVHAPAFAQRVKFDGRDGEGITVDVTPEIKGKASRKNTPKVLPVPQPPKEPTFTATGGFEATKEKARESAIRAAVEKLHDHMLQQSPSVRRMPTTQLVQSMVIPEHEKVTEEPIISETGKTETMYRITIALRVEAKHVRELRSRERSSEALWVLAGLGGLAAVFAVFFRIDAWTKGYLTSWLVLGTVGAGALLTGLWWLAK